MRWGHRVPQGERPSRRQGASGRRVSFPRLDSALIHRSHTPLPLPSERSFGRFWTVVLAAASLWLGWVGSVGWSALLAVVALLVLTLTLRRPIALAPLNRAWARLGLAMAIVVNPLVLGLMYFVLLAPLGQMLRVFGRDALRLRRPAYGTTLWLERDDDPRGRRAFRDQY